MILEPSPLEKSQVLERLVRVCTDHKVWMEHMRNRLIQEHEGDD